MIRTVIVTGGSRGLGLGIASRLAADGFRVIAIARKPSEALTAAQERLAGEGELYFHAADLAEIAAIPALVKELRGTYGKVYGLVNNAGIGTSGMLTTMPDLAIEQLLRLNVHAPLVLSKYAARSMMGGEGGRIVNIASVVAATGYRGLSVYSASKAALVGFTRSLARELGPLGVTVNAVSPGFIETEMTYGMEAEDMERIKRRSALKRMPEAEDVAAAVSFLCGAQARNITGTVMTVDAGNLT